MNSGPTAAPARRLPCSRERGVGNRSLGGDFFSSAGTGSQKGRAASGSAVSRSKVPKMDRPTTKVKNTPVPNQRPTARTWSVFVSRNMTGLGGRSGRFVGLGGLAEFFDEVGVFPAGDSFLGDAGHGGVVAPHQATGVQPEPGEVLAAV